MGEVKKPANAAKPAAPKGGAGKDSSQPKPGGKK